MVYDHVINFVDEPDRKPATVSQLSTDDIHQMLACSKGISPRDHDLPGTTVAGVVKRLEIELLIRRMGWR